MLVSGNIMLASNTKIATAHIPSENKVLTPDQIVPVVVLPNIFMPTMGSRLAGKISIKPARDSAKVRSMLWWRGR